MAQKRTTTRKKQKAVKFGGRRGIGDLPMWQKLLALVLFTGVISYASIAIYSHMKERDLIARAAKYTKVDIRSDPKSSAGVTFSACKALKGDIYTVTILATKPAAVAQASVTVQTFVKSGGGQKLAAAKTNKSWWGNEVSAMQLNVSKSRGDELLFIAKSKSGVSQPRFVSQPAQKKFKTKAAYQAAVREFQAATVNPASFTDCLSVSTQPVSTCLSRKGTRQSISKLQKTAFKNYSISNNTVIDASKAYWDGSDASGVPISWAIVVDGKGPACWYGGKYTGAWDDRSRTVTWSKDYHHAGAFTIRMNDFLVEGLRAHNQGDGIRMEQRGSNFHIKDVHLSDIHDDCVENDFLHNGITENSLFDGCYAGFSAATFEGINPDGSKNTWTIRNNLMSLKSFYTMFRPEKYGTYGYSMLFKGWFEKGKGPSLVLENNIFMADRPPSIGRLDIPPNADLKSCKNNTFVWLGQGPMPYKDQLPKNCFTFTTDKRVWDNAVAQWKKQHPNVL